MSTILSGKVKGLLLSAIFLFNLFILPQSVAQKPTRGIGIYPGAPEESFEPQLVGSNAFRNVALGRMVYQSSSFDFNMTAQLLTDGIISKGAPVYLEVTTPDGQLPQRQRESTIDGNDWTRSIVMGSDTWMQYSWHGMSIKADQIHLIGTVAYREGQATDGYCIRVMASQDGKRWQQVAIDESKQLLGRTSYGMVHSDPNKNADNADMLPTRRVDMKLPFDKAQTFSYLRVELLMKGAVYWTFTENPITLNGKRVEGLLPATGFTSGWMVQSNRDEWACVDLGAEAEISKVNLHWIEKPKSFEVQVSADGKQFSPFSKSKKARFVRVMIPSKGKEQRSILSEIEVMGRGGLVAQPSEAAGWQNGKFMLDGGDWRLQRASQVSARGAQISSKGFDASKWTVATVPATVLMSYVNAGALPNPNYDDNLLLTSESFFNSNFWYRREFQVPAEMKGQTVFLNFDGINWKADVWLNGQKVDRVEGAFMRGRTDITRYLREGVNVLAVEIEKCAHPGAVKLKNDQTTDYNGGLLGADNPTFHATVGWDWISTIRGRDIGIWDDVYLTASPSGLTLGDPIVRSKITINGTDTLATLTPMVVVANNTGQQQKTKLSGWIGNIKFEKEITLAAHSTEEISFSPADFPQLKVQKMHLWWPNGYGEAYLYDAGFSAGGSTFNYKAGIREVTYDEVATRLQIFVNGVRFMPMGGNWGFSENNLCYRGREYDAAVKYHRDMNLNCIRNWVGQVGDREFYEACDRYGVMIFQDFWLANPADGPNPYDNELFMKNARDMVLKVRQHPSIMLYCGRNEGYPPKELDDNLRKLVAELTPQVYISSSADDGVSGHGPYWAIPAKEYYQRQSGKLHTERGMPNIMTFEGFSRTFRPEHFWPQSEYWGQHDFTQQGAQRGASFNQLIARAFGEPKDAREFTTLAQWLNYDGYRAMYESTNHDRQGLLIWMSHPTWPSMVWQTYDYYFEPTAAYFGTKKACEPLHIQWNPLADSVEVVNMASGHRDGIAVARLYDMHGVEFWHNDAPFSSDDDTTVSCLPIEIPKDYKGVYFLRMEAIDAAGQKPFSENTYICSTDTGNYQALKALPQVKLKAKKEQRGNQMQLTLENTSHEPALLIRLNLVTDDGEQVLPVMYEDNYFHLMPGEQRTINVEWNPRDARGQQPHVEISGYNVPEFR
ncbi:MAG: discoidin domain-containing protein [Prevotella sp.]|nr:discoidin domain-containing protein [Prevotella sp.]